jgi:hypothetical protein
MTIPARNLSHALGFDFRSFVLISGKTVWYLPDEEFYPLSVGGGPIF